MIIEGEYFYKGATRLSWGFGSPNQLGAFLATAIPLVWGIAQAFFRKMPPSANEKKRSSPPKKKSWLARLAFWLLELILWLLLGATASRGAAVAALLAAAMWAFLVWRTEGERWADATGWLGLRIGMCVLGLVVFSFGGRIAPDFLAQDASIGNRFILWKGAAVLIAAAPWSGWGVGESGNAFMQWVQPLDRAEGYKTMVNSFLHVGVECGIPALGLVLLTTSAASSWAFAFGRYIKMERLKGFITAASCIVLAWALCNVFSTLFKDWRLWIFPGLAAAMMLVSLFFVRFSWPVLWRWLAFNTGATVATLLSVYVVGFVANGQRPIRIAHPSASQTLLSNAAGSKAQWGILTDPAILGRRGGHEIRRWGEGFAQAEHSWSVAMFDGRFWQPDSLATRALDRWILFGATAGEADKLELNKYVVFVHPRGQPPQRWNGLGIIVLNEIDEDGAREEWIQWANRLRLKIVMISGAGLDARSSWPEAYLSQIAL